MNQCNNGVFGSSKMKVNYINTHYGQFNVPYDSLDCHFNERGLMNTAVKKWGLVVSQVTYCTVQVHLDRVH
jgi:hypothetical protein